MAWHDITDVMGMPRIMLLKFECLSAGASDLILQAYVCILASLHVSSSMEEICCQLLLALRLAGVYIFVINR